jgi:glycosyltransferase involved in cell wall biosynthesis
MDFLSLPVFPANAKQPAIRRLARLGDATLPLRFALRHRQIAMLRKAIGKGSRDPVLFFGHPEMAALAEAFPRSPVVYDHMDDILGFGDPPPSLGLNLKRIVKRANLVNATSERLADDMRLMGAKRVMKIGNGVEWNRFLEGASLPVPAALAAMTGPRALYMGSLAEWFDFDLLFRVARALPKVSFPLVGPLRPELNFRRDKAPANVHFLGARPYPEVPAWMAHSDLALIPFLRTPLTEAVDPVKLHEYLASGLPVVSTPFSNELMAHSAAVTLAEDSESFAEAMSSVLADPPDTEALRQLAAGQDWNKMLEPLVKELLKL